MIRSLGRLLGHAVGVARASGWRVRNIVVLMCGVLSVGAATPTPQDALDDRVTNLSKGLINQNGRTRDAVALELLRIGPPAISPLLRLASQEGLQERDAIRTLLPRYGPERIPDFISAAPYTRGISRGEAALAVSRMGEAARTAAVEGLRSEDTGRFTFWIDVLDAMGTDATPTLIYLLDDPKPNRHANCGDNFQCIPIEAARLLAKHPDPRAAEALLKALANTDAVVRIDAADTLGKLRDRRAMVPLLHALHESHNPMERASMAAALGRFDDPSLVQPIAAVARSDGDVYARESAADALLHEFSGELAKRLGRRYKPISASPSHEDSVLMWYVLSVTATGLLFLLALRVAFVAKGNQPSASHQPLWWCAVTAAAMGFGWGRLMPGMSGVVEDVLLLVCIPLAVVVGWRIGPTLEPIRAIPIGIGGMLVFEFTIARFMTYLEFGAMGYFAPRLSLFLIAVVVGHAMTQPWRGSRDSLVSFRSVTCLCAGAFYLGYGIGWLALWGYFGL